MEMHECYQLKLEKLPNGILVVRFPRDRIDDEYAAAYLEPQFAEILSRQEMQVLTDFDGIRYVGSTCIAKLIVFNKRLKQRGGKLVLCTSNNSDTHDLFSLVRLDKCIPVAIDMEQAIELL